MPSNPKLQRLITFVRNHHGGEESLLGLLRSGSNCVRIARALEKSALEEHHIERDTIALSDDSVRLMLKKFDADAYKDALKDGAQALMDETVEIADQVPATREDVAKAKLRIDTRANLAGKLDREKWGDQPAPAVQLNVGMDFIRAAARPNVLPPPKPKELPPVDAEVEEEEPAKPQASARVHARIEEIMKLGHSRDQAIRLAVHLEHAEQKPEVNETIPGLGVKLIKEEEAEADD